MNWKVYDRSKYEDMKHADKPDTCKLAPLGDFLCIDTVAGNKAVVYVDEGGELKWIHSACVLLRPHTTHIETGPRSANRPLRSGS